MMHAFEGNRAETKTILPVARRRSRPPSCQFRRMRIAEMPYQVSRWRSAHLDEPSSTARSSSSPG